MIPDIMKMAIAEIDPEADICVIPSSKPKLNNLQIALGNNSLIKVKETETRKHDHASDISNEMDSSIKINHIKTSDSLIIIDDIITSGKTMQYFVNLMSVFGYDHVHILVYGITDTFVKRYDKPKSVSMFDTMNISLSNIPDMSLMIPSTHIAPDTKAIKTNEDINTEHTPQTSRSVMLKRPTIGVYRRAYSETQLLDLHNEPFENGCSYHFLTAGDVDALSYLKLILRQQNLDYCLFSTWCMAKEDVYQIKDWLEYGKIKTMDAYVGEIFPGSYKMEYTLLKPIIESHGGKVKVFKNHSKIFAGYGNKFYFGIQTSANINTNPRTENACITIDKNLYDFYKDYFDKVVSYE